MPCIPCLARCIHGSRVAQRPSLLFFDFRSPTPKSPKSRICAVGVRHRYVAKSLMYHTANTTSARPYTTFRPRNVDQITQWVDAARSARQANRRPLRPPCRLLQSFWRNSPYNWSDRHIHFRVGPPRCAGPNHAEGTPLASTACKTKRMSAKRPPQLPPPRSARSRPRSVESVPPRVAQSGWFGTVDVIG